MFGPLLNYRVKNPFTVLRDPDNIPNIARVFCIKRPMAKLVYIPTFFHTTPFRFRSVRTI